MLTQQIDAVGRRFRLKVVVVSVEGRFDYNQPSAVADDRQHNLSVATTVTRERERGIDPQIAHESQSETTVVAEI